MIESGISAIDAGQSAKHPFTDGAERVVAEGIHGGIVTTEAFLFRITVPAFPDGGRSVDDLVPPGRELATLEEPDGQVVITVGGQDRQELLGPQETGGHAIAMASDLVGESVGRLLPLLLREQVEGQCKNVGGLRFDRQRVVFADVVRGKSGFDLSVQIPVECRVALGPDRRGHLRDEL